MQRLGPAAGPRRRGDRSIEELERVDCPPHDIGIELTETAVMANLDDASRQIDEIRAHGIKVALDDFGTGHSSLALLRSMTVDELKVDKSFGFDMGAGSRNLAIVRAMAALGRDLGLTVVAEGVETLDQAGFLPDTALRPRPRLPVVRRRAPGRALSPGAGGPLAPVVGGRGRQSKGPRHRRRGSTPGGRRGATTRQWMDP